MGCESLILNGIAEECVNNTGGVKAVYLIPFGNLAPVVTDGIVDSINVTELKTFNEYKFRKNVSYMNSTVASDQTIGYAEVTTELFMQFTKMDGAKALEINKLGFGLVSAVVVDNNGVGWLVGSEEYMSATAGSGNTGTARTDLNGFSITLSSMSKNFPYEMSDAAMAEVIAAL